MHYASLLADYYFLILFLFFFLSSTDLKGSSIPSSLKSGSSQKSQGHPSLSLPPTDPSAAQPLISRANSGSMAEVNPTNGLKGTKSSESGNAISSSGLKLNLNSSNNFNVGANQKQKSAQTHNVDSCSYHSTTDPIVYRCVTPAYLSIANSQG